MKLSTNPHFSQAFYCGVGYGHVYGVALGRAPRHTVKYACGALRRAPCIHTRLRRLATKSCEKCGLSILLPGDHFDNGTYLLAAIPAAVRKPRFSEPQSSGNRCWRVFHLTTF